jgi:hypothetical protein
MLKWSLFFQIVLLFCPAFPGYLFESATESSYGVEVGIETDAWQD